MTGLGEKCTVESCVEMVQAIDADGNGYISFEEFKTLYSILRTWSLDIAHCNNVSIAEAFG